MSEVVLQAVGLRKRFGTLTAVDDLSLEVRDGEIFGLLGPNGAGKTTLVKVLLGICHATAGQARLMGRPVGDARARREVGYLPEHLRLPDFLNAETALHFLGRLSGMPSEARRKAVPELLERVGLASRRRSKVRTFSKGMIQRLGLAQALLHRPRLLVLDEPTDGVDPIGRKEIRDVLLELRGTGTTIFLNSHLLSEIEMICDRVAILDHGKILRVGDVRELTRRRDRWRIAVEGDVDAARAALAETRSPDVVRGALEFSATSAEELNAAIDLLRAKGVLIREVHAVSASLEEAFLEIVGHSREEAS